jgi:uncharacterized damage-inducible protein DinB
MITPVYAQRMAAYNRWQNTKLLAAAGSLSDEERRADRGAFFGSIFGTLNHLLWGDTIWLHRFAGMGMPESPNIPVSVDETGGWSAYCARREAKDHEIIAWAAGLTDAALAGGLTYYSQAVERKLTKPLALFVMHFFNHQTHHRGQVHAMLTACGKDYGDTDVAFMPEELAG